MRNDVDPFQLEIIRNCFDAIAEDMALTLLRTAHSGIVRDSLDFSTSICDARGQPVAQGMCTPLQLGSFYDAMAKVIELYEGRINDQDIFILNDPFEAAGQHLPDIYIVMPIFHCGRLAAWATTIAHHSDVGGIVAGSNALGVSEIYQEGLRLPVLKLRERGQYNQAIWDVIAINVRTPDKVLGDLQAQIAACISGEREMQALFDRYGLDIVTRYADYLQDYTERLTRTELREIPEGTYRFTDHIDGFGPDPEPVVFKVAVTIKDGHAIIDWAGSSAQVKCGINPSFPFTKASAYTAFRSLLRTDVPNCHGFTRAIEVRAPLGSIMNPRFPAPCGARGISGFRMIDCLFGAMAQAIPDRVPADGSGGTTLPTIAGYQDGKAFVFCETFMGSGGATALHDGQGGLPHVGANQTNVPVEMIEKDYPIRIESYGMVCDTGGPGRSRGGLALTREYRILAKEASLNVRSDKRKFPPYGLFGGNDGSPSISFINPEAENRTLPVLMMEIADMKEGDLFRHITAGGGGYGPALDREAASVLDDIHEDRVSVEGARTSYGVVVDGHGRKAVVNVAATQSLRTRMRQGHQQAPAASAQSERVNSP